MKISKTHFRTATKLSALGGVAGLALLLAPHIATAQPGPPHGRPGAGAPKCMPAHVKAQLPLFDANKNGRLDPQEHRAMREAERKADLTTYDADGDGRLSKEERASLHHGKMVERFEQLDTDRNAEISQAEAADSCTPVEHHFARIDSDSNGSITWAEFESAAPRGPQQHEGPRRHKGHHGPGGPEARRGPGGPDGPHQCEGNR